MQETIQPLSSKTMMHSQKRVYRKLKRFQWRSVDRLFQYYEFKSWYDRWGNLSRLKLHSQLRWYRTVTHAAKRSDGRQWDAGPRGGRAVLQIGGVSTLLSGDDAAPFISIYPELRYRRSSSKAFDWACSQRLSNEWYRPTNSGEGRSR